VSQHTRRLLWAAILVPFRYFGVFPLPDPRHGTYGLGLTIHFAHFLLAAALWNRSDLHTLDLYLIMTGVMMLALLAVVLGIGSLATPSDAGVLTRVYALAVFPWLGIAGYVLDRRLRPHS
jgi:hypothetical protein